MCVERQNKALKRVWSVKCASSGFPEKRRSSGLSQRRFPGLT